MHSWICPVLGNQIGLGSSDGPGVNARAKLPCQAISASARRGFHRPKASTRFDFNAQPSLNKTLILELARCEWIEKRQSCTALGPSGTAHSHPGFEQGLVASDLNLLIVSP